MRRRQRRGRQHRRRRAGAGRRARRHRRGRRALHAPRLQHAGGVGLPDALSGARQPRDRRPVDHHPAGALGGRRHDGQLDVVVPHARAHAGALGASATASTGSTRRRWRRTSPPSRSGCRSGPATPTTSTATTASCWDGATKLGWQPELIRRSVKGCARLGYCGMGCPIDAKQSALITYVPDAIAAGADVFTDCRARSVETDRGARARWSPMCSTARAIARAGDSCAHAPRGVVLAGGAINTPALLLRSHVGNGSGLVGRRTFLHPTVPLVALLRRAHRSVLRRAAIGRLPPLRRSRRAHRLLPRDRADSPDAGGHGLPGLRRRAPPSCGAPGRTRRRRSRCSSTASTTTRAAGRVVARRPHQGPYPLGGARARRPSTPSPTWRALQLAAGASEVMTLHEDPIVIRSEADIAQIARAPFGPNRHTLFSAHQMGGCAMGGDSAHSVVNAAAATTRSTTSGSPTARSSRPAWA